MGRSTYKILSGLGWNRAVHDHCHGSDTGYRWSCTQHSYRIQRVVACHKNAPSLVTGCCRVRPCDYAGKQQKEKQANHGKRLGSVVGIWHF